MTDKIQTHFRKQIIDEMKAIHDKLIDLKTPLDEKLKLQSELRELTNTLSEIKGETHGHKTI